MKTFSRGRLWPLFVAVVVAGFGCGDDSDRGKANASASETEVVRPTSAATLLPTAATVRAPSVEAFCRQIDRYVSARLVYVAKSNQLVRDRVFLEDVTRSETDEIRNLLNVAQGVPIQLPPANAGPHFDRMNSLVLSLRVVDERGQSALEAKRFEDTNAASAEAEALGRELLQLFNSLC